MRRPSLINTVEVRSAIIMYFLLLYTLWYTRSTSVCESSLCERCDERTAATLSDPSLCFSSRARPASAHSAQVCLPVSFSLKRQQRFRHVSPRIQERRLKKCGCRGTFCHFFTRRFRVFFCLDSSRPKTIFDFGKHVHTTFLPGLLAKKTAPRTPSSTSSPAYSLEVYNIYTDQPVRA